MTTKTTKPKAHNGLSKRCTHPRRTWGECACSWHLEFYHSKSAHHYGGKAKHKYSLDVVAEARGVAIPKTKDEAASLADRVRSEIRSGTFVVPGKAAPVATGDPTALTVTDVIVQYLARHVQMPDRRLTAQRAMRWMLGVIERTEIPGARGQMIVFGTKPIASVTKADVEAIRAARRAAQTTTRRHGEVGINRLLARLRHLFSWSVEEGFIEVTPFRIKLTKEHARHRRLLGIEEEQRLLAAADPYLRDVLIALIATACRKGELLSLQWRDIVTTTTSTGQTKQTVIVRAENAKTDERREIHVGAKLATVLTMRRHRPDGTPHGPTAYVFGTPLGEQVKSLKTAWMVCVLTAYGHVPTFTKQHLSAESRAIYRQIDIHMHDLRREAASRLVEAGATLVEAQRLLGHSSVQQTTKYLASSPKALESAIDRKEAHEAQLAEMQAQREAEMQAQPPPPSVLAPSSERVQ